MNFYMDLDYVVGMLIIAAICIRFVKVIITSKDETIEYQNEIIEGKDEVISQHLETIAELKAELHQEEQNNKMNEAFLFAIGDLIPEEEKSIKLVDRDKEPSLLFKIWCQIEDALYK